MIPQDKLIESYFNELRSITDSGTNFYHSFYLFLCDFSSKSQRSVSELTIQEIVTLLHDFDFKD